MYNFPVDIMSIHVNDSTLGKFSKHIRHSSSVMFSIYFNAKLKFVDSCFKPLFSSQNLCMEMDTFNSLLRYKM